MKDGPTLKDELEMSPWLVRRLWKKPTSRIGDLNTQQEKTLREMLREYRSFQKPSIALPAENKIVEYVKDLMLCARTKTI